MSLTNRPSHLIVACLGATWLVWGSTYLAIRFALAGFAPFFLMGSRFIVAGVLLATWEALRGKPWPTLRQWRNAAIVGGLMLGGGMGGTAYAEQTVGSGLVVAFIAVVPIMIVIVNRLFGIRPQTSELAGVLTGLLGVIMLTQGQGFSASPTGLAALVSATLAWSVGSVLSLRVLPLAPGAMGFASEMLSGGVLLLAASLLVGEPVHAASTSAWIAWGYLVVFGSLIAFNAYMLLLSRASAAVASSYTFVNPVVALGLGIWLGGERVSGFEWLSVAVTLAGVVLLLWRRRTLATAS